MEKDHLLSQKGDKKGDEKAMKKEDEIKARADAALKAITANPQITVNELASELNVSRKQTENQGVPRTGTEAECRKSRPLTQGDMDKF